MKPRGTLTLQNSFYMFCLKIVILLPRTLHAREPLYLLGLYPLTGPVWPGGEALLPASQMAIADINANSSILSDYELKLIVKDTECLGGRGTNAMFEELYKTESTKIVILGGGCSSVTIPTAEASPQWNLVQISFSAYSSLLSNRNLYPLFFRMAPDRKAQNVALIEMVKYFGWKKLALIWPAGDLYGNAMLDFRHKAVANNIDIVVAESFEGDPTLQVANIKKLKARIIFGNFYDSDARQVLCRAYKEGLYGKKYVWILPGWFVDGWWTLNNDQIDCSLQEMHEVVKGYLTAEVVAMADGTASERVSGLTAQEYQERFDELVDHKSASLTGIEHGPYGYDTVWAAALALDRADKHLKDMDPPSSLLDFDYFNSNMTNIIFQKFSDTNFEGVTGTVKFTQTGDRLGPMQIEQNQNGTEEIIGYYDPASATDSLLTWTNKPPVYWADGKPPVDSFLEENEYQTISTVLFATMTILAVIGIIMAVIFLTFNVLYSDRRIIKMSSPRLNNVIATGGLLVYISIIFLGIDIKRVTKQTYSVTSKIFVWCLAIGFSMSFGAMFSKTWRVHRIFTTKSVVPKRIRDGQLLVQVAVIVAVDVAILTAWEVLDPRIPYTFLGKTKVDPTNDDIHITEVYIHFASRWQLYWMGAIFVVNGLLLVFGAFLAWETRKVSMPALNDSKYIGMSLYTVVIMCFTGVPVSLVIQEPNTHFVLLSLFIFFSTSVTLCLVFIPKVKMRNMVYPTGTLTNNTATEFESDAQQKNKCKASNAQAIKVSSQTANKATNTEAVIM